MVGLLEAFIAAVPLAPTLLATVVQTLCERRAARSRDEREGGPRVCCSVTVLVALTGPAGDAPVDRARR